MLTLYYSPGACSLSVHILLRELNLEFDLKKVNLKEHTLADGTALENINPKNYVPILVDEQNRVFTEASAILNYLTPAKSDRYEQFKLCEWLSFVSTELHKSFGAFFKQDSGEEYKQVCRDKLRKRCQYVNDFLAKNEFLGGSEFCAADAYLFTILRWLKFVHTGVQIADFPYIEKYYQNIAQRPSVQSATEAEKIRT